MSETTTETTRVTEERKTTIPRRLREKYGIEPGDEVVWIEDEDGIRLVRADRSAGRGVGVLAPDADEAEREALADAMTADIRESQRTEWDVWGRVDLDRGGARGRYARRQPPSTRDDGHRDHRHDHR